MFHGAGPGRPKGMQNKLTLKQREVAEMVLGKPGTIEFDEFIQTQRAQMLSGEMPPVILQTWLHYLIGKPKEVVEVQGEVTLQRVVREVIDINAEPPHQLDAVH